MLTSRPSLHRRVLLLAAVLGIAVGGLVATPVGAATADAGLVTVSGHVAGSDTPDLGGAWVSASSTSETDYLEGDEMETDTDGDYSLSLEPGEWRVCASAEDAGYRTVCRTVTVGPDGLADQDLTLPVIVMVTIKGSVHDRYGAPVVTTVDAYGTDDGFGSYGQARTESAADGTFSVRVAADTYRLCAGDSSQGQVARTCWRTGGEDQAEPVDATKGDVAGIDLVAERHSLLVGRVRLDQATSPDFRTLLVQAFDDNLDNFRSWDVEPDSDGRFVVPVPPGTYRVRFRETTDRLAGVDRVFWTSKGMMPGIEDAEPVTVGREAVRSLGDVSVPLEKGAISGRVTGVVPPYAGHDGQRVTLSALTRDTTTGTWRSEVDEKLHLGSDAVSTERFVLGLVAGTYRLRLTREDGVTTWFGGTSLESARDVTVTDDRQTTGVDLQVGTQLPAYVPGRPRIVGNPTVGQTVTLDPGTWPAGTTLATTWPDGSHGSGYTVRAADRGQLWLPVVQATVVATTPGYVDRTVTAVASPSAGPATAVTNLTPPTVTGTPQVGRLLSGKPGTWSPSGTATAYQWLRDGSAITGATGATYAPVAADVGSSLTLRVTATTTGLTSGVLTSAPTTAVLPGVIEGAVPATRGTARVGRYLTASAGTTRPAGCTVTYQWLRNGVAISGATKVSYKLARADRRRRVSVRVTRTRTGWTTLTRTSVSRRIA